jgi:hypothetical protein
MIQNTLGQPRGKLMVLLLGEFSDLKNGEREK